MRISINISRLQVQLDSLAADLVIYGAYIKGDAFPGFLSDQKFRDSREINKPPVANDSNVVTRINAPHKEGKNREEGQGEKRADKKQRGKAVADDDDLFFHKNCPLFRI